MTLAPGRPFPIQPLHRATLLGEIRGAVFTRRQNKLQTRSQGAGGPVRTNRSKGEKTPKVSAISTTWSSTYSLTHTHTHWWVLWPYGRNHPGRRGPGAARVRLLSSLFVPDLQHFGRSVDSNKGSLNNASRSPTPESPLWPRGASCSFEHPNPHAAPGFPLLVAGGCSFAVLTHAPRRRRSAHRELLTAKSSSHSDHQGPVN